MGYLLTFVRQSFRQTMNDNDLRVTRSRWYRYEFQKIDTHQSLFSSCAKHCCTIRLDFSEGFSTALLLESSLIRHLLRLRTGTFEGILLRDSTSSAGLDW